MPVLQMSADFAIRAKIEDSRDRNLNSEAMETLKNLDDEHGLQNVITLQNEMEKDTDNLKKDVELKNNELSANVPNYKEGILYQAYKSRLSAAIILHPCPNPNLRLPQASALPFGLNTVVLKNRPNMMKGYNLTVNIPMASLSHNLINKDAKNTPKSRRELKQEKINHNIASTSQENSLNHKNHHGQNKIVTNKPVEGLVFSQLSRKNMRLEACSYKLACKDCASRMKNCLQCGVVVQKRVTKDDRIIPAKGKQSSAERMRYLECKIAKYEKGYRCNICMERKRNVVFLCGHGTCSKCADTLKTCHMCRKTITKKIHIY